MKLTLIQKSIILVSVPLVFEVVFVAVLANLLIQAETECANVFRAAKIGNCSNKLIRDVFEFAAVGHGEILGILSSDHYSSIVSTINSDLSELQASVEKNSPEQTIVNSSIIAGQKALDLISQIHSTYESGDAYGAIDQLKRLQYPLRNYMKQTISRDLVLLAETQKKKAEDSYKKQSDFRKQFGVALVAGLLLNLVITILVAFFVSKKIVGKLVKLIDNNYRLAEGLPLNSLIGGNDEIADLDITFHEMANSLEEAKEREQSMIRHSADIICSLDQKGRLIAINPACRQILGYSEDMIIGMNLRSMLIEEDIDSFNKFLISIMLGQKEIEFESRIKKQNGGIINLLWSIHWVDSEKSFFCVGHDITQRKELERIKQQFMAMISHDLRTPLTTIGNYLEMLSAGILGDLTEKGQHLLQIAESNVSQMLNLINDLLDLERAEFDGLKLDCSDQDLNDLIEQSVKSITSHANKKHIKIIFDSTNLTVFADNKRILQVLTNLLNNAIKFSPQNSIIEIVVKQVEGIATVYISDQGRGVPENMKLAIFERFQQVEASDASKMGGSGLGLAICKIIVELHGGKIEVENNLKGGSTFSFTLPLGKEGEKQAA